MKVRVSQRVLFHLSGSDAWQSPGRDPLANRLMAKLQGKPRKDGSITVDLDASERDCLYEYADMMAIGARDNIEPPGQSYGDNWALSDYNAAAGLMRQLEKLARNKPPAQTRCTK